MATKTAPQRIARKCQARFSRIDGRANTVGAFRLTNVHEDAASDWAMLMDLNARSAQRLSEVVPPAIRTQGSPHIQQNAKPIVAVQRKLGMGPHLTRRGALVSGLVLLMPAPATAQSVNFGNAPERRLSARQWRDRLTPSAYQVLRRHQTELPFTSPLNGERRRGVYVCAGCRSPLFRSEWKFNSGTGWPSFFRVMDDHIATRLDRGFGMTRTEYHCARCLGHQGHRFDDGPRPTGQRYCNNGAALAFQAEDDPA